MTGRWATFERVPSQRYARERLAITPDFKDDVGAVVVFELREPLRARVGIVGRQPVSGRRVPGGGTQVHFYDLERGELARFAHVLAGGKGLP